MEQECSAPESCKLMNYRHSYASRQTHYFGITGSPSPDCLTSRAWPVTSEPVAQGELSTVQVQS